jgi:hypothetical protein
MKTNKKQTFNNIVKNSGTVLSIKAASIIDGEVIDIFTKKNQCNKLGIS